MRCSRINRAFSTGRTFGLTVILATGCYGLRLDCEVTPLDTRCSFEPTNPPETRAMNAYSIRDVKAAASNIPFFSPTRSTAMRKLSVGLEEDPMMAKYAADFQLFEVGIWDPVTGILSGQQPHHVCDISELLDGEKPSAGQQT